MPPSEEPAKLRFNCYLLRDDIDDVEKALRAKYRPGGKTGLQKIAASSGAPKGSAAYLGTSTDKTPKWAQELDTLFPGVGQITSRSNRFVIFLPVGSRWFAVCFGYGSGVLEWERIESNFGLRLAARRFRPNDLIELRSRRIDASARTQSVQVPVGSELRDLGVELDGEFVRKLSGRLDAQGVDDVSGAVVAGDSIAFKASIDLANLQKMLAQMLGTVETSVAHEEFEFVDSLEPLRESEQTSKDLDARLAAELLGRPIPDNKAGVLSAHVLEFAPPDDVRLDEVEAISVSYGDRETELGDFTIASLRLALHEVGVQRGAGFLKAVRLIARGADDEERSQLLPLRNWLVYEAGDSVARYVLTLGRWFRLQESYSNRLNLDLKKIEDVSKVLSLVSTTDSEWEAAYNARAAKADASLILLDKVNIKTEDGTVFEGCDLLHLDGYLIHVKRYNGSQTLSHLFSQGAVSAELFNEDQIAKADFVQKVTDLDQSFKAVADDAPQVVTYAIALDDSKNLPLDLPTFSKVNLRDFARRLRRMKVRPTLARIRIEAGETTTAGS